MNRYICLIRFTEKGAREIKQSTARARTFDAAAEKAGVKIVGQYWTTGACDGVLILGADRSEDALRCLVDLVSAGNVTTETMQAYTDAEFNKIVGV